MSNKDKFGPVTRGLCFTDAHENLFHAFGTTLPDVVCLSCVVQVYAVYFKTNRRLIREYPNLRNYTAEIYQMSGKWLAVMMVNSL